MQHFPSPPLPSGLHGWRPHCHISCCSQRTHTRCACTVRTSTCLIWLALLMRTLQVRSAGLDDANYPLHVAAWLQPLGSSVLASSLRLLDLGGNDKLNTTDIGAFFSRLPLWEL